MRVVVVSKDNTDYARGVTTFVDDFSRQTGHALDVIDPESNEGEMFAETYDIVAYPTVIVLSDDGRVQNIWSGRLPTISEVSYYAMQN